MILRVYKCHLTKNASDTNLVTVRKSEKTHVQVKTTKEAINLILLYNLKNNCVEKMPKMYIDSL